MTCRCGESKREKVRHAFRRTVAGTTFTADASVDACAGCGEVHVPAALVISFERAVALELARRGPISGETFRWIRKAAGLERVELAELVGISAEVMAAWEEERRSTDPAAWNLVAAMALDAHEGPRPVRSRIKARRRGRSAAGTAARLTLESATSGTLAKVLELLGGPSAFTDGDIADALDVDASALRARLRELEAACVVRSTGSSQGDVPLRWELTSHDRAELARAALDAGVELDSPLPRAKGAVGPTNAVARGRRAPAAWRAST